MMPQSRLLLGIVLLVVILAASFALPNSSSLWQTIRTQLVEWQSFASTNRVLAAVLFVVAYAAVTGLSLPLATVFSLLAGALFGRWLGTVLAVTAATLGATASFLTSRYLVRDAVRARFGSRLQPIEDGFARDGAFYLLTLRLMPILPFFVINLAMGLTPIRTRIFVIVSWLGMIPGGFVIVNAGTAAAQIESPRGLISSELLFALCLLAILPLLARWVLNRIRVQSSQAKHAPPTTNR